MLLENIHPFSGLGKKQGDFVLRWKTTAATNEDRLCRTGQDIGGHQAGDRALNEKQGQKSFHFGCNHKR